MFGWLDVWLQTREALYAQLNCHNMMNEQTEGADATLSPVPGQEPVQEPAQDAENEAEESTDMSTGPSTGAFTTPQTN